MNFPRLQTVQAPEKYKLDLLYSDGESGRIDLEHLVQQEAFGIWQDGNAFFDVYADAETGAIAWNNSLDICPNAAYLRLKGLTYEQWFEQNRSYTASV